MILRYFPLSTDTPAPALAGVDCVMVDTSVNAGIGAV
jgi:hypothetical protein